MRLIESKPDGNLLNAARRWSGLYTIGLIILLLVFFGFHQWKRTGFFTDRFGPIEMAALYLPIVISLVAPLLRTIQGKNDPARLLEAVSDISLAVGSIWLWIAFPFDFTHFADVFPPSIHPAFSWINDRVGRIILLLQVALGLISVLATTVSYLRERRAKTAGGEAEEHSHLQLK